MTTTTTRTARRLTLFAPFSAKRLWNPDSLGCVRSLNLERGIQGWSDFLHWREAKNIGRMAKRKKRNVLDKFLRKTCCYFDKGCSLCCTRRRRRCALSNFSNSENLLQQEADKISVKCTWPHHCTQRQCALHTRTGKFVITVKGEKVQTQSDKILVSFTWSRDWKVQTFDLNIRLVQLEWKYLAEKLIHLMANAKYHTVLPQTFWNHLGILTFRSKVKKGVNTKTKDQAFPNKTQNGSMSNGQEIH